MNNQTELKELEKISEISIYTSLIIIPLSVIFSMLAGSGTLLIYFIWAAAAISVKVFALFSIRIMLKENQFMFPYGAGKLENTSSFLFGVSIVPMGVYFLVVSISRLLAPLPSVTYPLCLIPVALSFFLTLILTNRTNRIIRQNTNPTPLLKAYNVNFKVSMTSDAFLFLAFLAGFFFNVAHLDSLSLRVDPVLSILLSLYMIWVGLPLILDNVRSLIDLPLPEKDMLKILKVATEFFDEYSGFGMLYTRQSGKQKFIEMELLFDPVISLEKIIEVESRMAERISHSIPDVQFRLIPKLKES